MKSANEIVLDELNRREAEKGSGKVFKSIGISRAFEDPIYTDGMTDDEKLGAFFSRKPKASEKQIAAEVLRVHDELARKSPDELRTEQLTYVYENLQKAFKAVSFDRMARFRDASKAESSEQLESRLMEAWGHLEGAMLILGNYIDRSKLNKDV